jgi:hypothetical protein
MAVARAARAVPVGAIVAACAAVAVNDVSSPGRLGAGAMKVYLPRLSASALPT